MASGGFRAKYAGLCAKCGEQISVGDAITWARTGAHGQRYYHATDRCRSLPFLPKEQQTMEQQTMTAITATTAPRVEPVRPTPEAPAASPAVPEQPRADRVGDLGAILADAVRPHLEHQVDREEVERIVRDAVGALDLDAVKTTIRTHRVEITTPEGVRKLERTHERFADVLRAVQLGRKVGYSVYLTGPPGSGKSTIGHQIAESLGLDFYLATLAPQSPPSAFVGYGTADGHHVETDPFRAYTRGGVLLVEEIDNANDGVLTSFNAALANGLGSWPVVGTVPKHPDFVLIAAGNTAGLGPTASFPSRRRLDAAFRDRFVFMDVHYDEGLEMALALEANPGARAWVDWCRAVRKWAAKEAPGLHVTPRSVVYGAALMTLPEMTPKGAALAAVFRGAGEDIVRRAVVEVPLPTVAETKRGEETAG